MKAYAIILKVDLVIPLTCIQVFMLHHFFRRKFLARNIQFGLSAGIAKL